MDDIVRGEFDENTVREDFLPSEMAAISKQLGGPEREAATSRMLSGKKQPSGNFPQGTGKSRDKVARFAGISARTLDKITEVCDAAEAEPDKYQALVDEMDKTRRVNGVYRKLKIARQVERIEKEPRWPTRS